MKRLAAVAVALALGGCAWPGGMAVMTPEQIHESAKIKDANLICVKVVTMSGTGSMLIVNSDKGIPSGMKIKPDCEAEFDTKPPAKP